MKLILLLIFVLLLLCVCAFTQVRSGSVSHWCSQWPLVGTCQCSSHRWETLPSTTDHSSTEVSQSVGQSVRHRALTSRLLPVLLRQLLSPLVHSNHRSSHHLHVRLAGSRCIVGFPDLETERWPAGQRLFLPGDGVCLRLLPLHLHPHLSKCFIFTQKCTTAPSLWRSMNPCRLCWNVIFFLPRFYGLSHSSGCAGCWSWLPWWSLAPCWCSHSGPRCVMRPSWLLWLQLWLSCCCTLC